MSRSDEIGDALDVIAHKFGTSIHAGAEVHGRLIDYGGDLEVEVMLRVKRRVSLSQNTRYRERAMALLATEGWHDRCPHWVKARGPFRKERQCSGKVTTVIVRNGYGDMVGPIRPGEYRHQVPTERFEFVCSHHADVNAPDVLAIVRLDQAALRALRAKRQREADERAARERARERELEAEVRTLSDVDLARRLAEFVSTHAWDSEDICLREQRRRKQGAA